MSLRHTRKESIKARLGAELDQWNANFERKLEAQKIIKEWEAKHGQPFFDFAKIDQLIEEVKQLASK